MKLLACVLVAVFMFAGCSGVEISERDFVVIMGIDKGENGFKVTGGSALLTGEGGGEGKLNIKTSQGNSLVYMFEADDNKDALKSYYGQLKTVVIGEDIAKDEETFKETIEVLLKNNDINLKTIIVASNDEAEKIVNAVGQKDNEYGLFIWDFYKNIGKESDRTYKLTIKGMAEKQYGGYILPIVSLDGADIVFGGGYVMDGINFKGKLDEKHMKSAMIMDKKVKDAVLEEGDNALKIKNNRIKISLKHKDKNVLCSIDMFIKAELLTDEFDFSKAERQLKEDTEAMLTLVYKEMNVDLFSLSEGNNYDMDFDVAVFIDAE